MVFRLLLIDELRHLWRSRLMKYLLGVLPLIVLIPMLGPREDWLSQIPMATIVLVQISGLLTGAMVTASLITDIANGVPVLYAVRPCPRGHFLLARSTAMGLLLMAAVSLAMVLAFGVMTSLEVGVCEAFKLLGSLWLRSLSGVLMATSSGALIGVLVENMPAGLFAFVMLGNNLVMGVMILADKWQTLFPTLQAWGEVLTFLLSCAVCLSLFAFAQKRFKQRSL